MKPEEVKEGEAKPEEKKEEEAPAQEEKEENEILSLEDLKIRITQLIDSISHVSFHFTRRGLFEKHKLIVSSMLTFRILQRSG